MVNSTARMGIVPLTQSQECLRPRLTSTMQCPCRDYSVLITQTNERVYREEGADAGATLSGKVCVGLNMTGNKWKGETLIYITGATTSTTASRRRGGKSTGSLLCLNGSHAETSHSYKEKHNRYSLCFFTLLSQYCELLQSWKNCQHRWLWGTPSSTALTIKAYSEKAHRLMSDQCLNDLIYPARQYTHLKLSIKRSTVNYIFAIFF